MIVLNLIAMLFAMELSSQVDKVYAIDQNRGSHLLCENDQQTHRISIQISLNEQKLRLYQGGEILQTYLISTSAKGAGEHLNSLKTPRGLHRIYGKIGGGAPLYTIFKARRNQGICWSKDSVAKGDFILSRILVLEGLESGFNRGTDAQNQCVDTRQRHIYIHGTHQEEKIGSPISHGCIRMKNCDVAELFESVPIGAQVFIK